MTPVEFLTARYDEIEARAKAAPGPDWVAVLERSGSPGHWHGVKAELVCLPGATRADPLQVGADHPDYQPEWAV